MSKIVLDYKQDPELFNRTAKTWAEKINRTKKTQVRNYYDKILELESDSKKDGFENVLPFVKMLNSKVAYGVGRRVVSYEFQEMMSECIKQVKNENDLKVFKLFFEAVLGFFKGRD